MLIVMCGYIAGILHKLVFHYDPVIYLYGLNLLMVAIDVLLYARNRSYEKKNNSQIITD